MLIVLLIPIFLFSCTSDNNLDPGLYLLKQLSDPEKEDGIMLKVTNDSITMLRCGSIFLSIDYQEIIRAKIGHSVTNSDTIQYRIYEKDNNENKSILEIITPNNLFEYELIEVNPIIPSISEDRLATTQFKLQRDTLIKLYLSYKNNAIYEYDNTQLEFQNWYSLDFKQSSCIVLDGFYKKVLQLIIIENELQLYSPFDDEIYAIEIVNSSNDSDRENEIDVRNIYGKWVIENDRNSLSAYPDLTIKLGEVAIDSSCFTFGRDTSVYFLMVKEDLESWKHGIGSKLYL